MAIKPVPEALGIKEIKKVGELYNEPEIRTLFFFLYLTGSRISEALKVRIRDIEFVKDKGLGEIMKVHLFTLKNRRSKFRDVPVLVKDEEKSMVEYILRFIRSQKRDPESFLFSISRTNAWNKLTHVEIKVRAAQGTKVIEDLPLRIHPHYLRHCRATYLSQVYGLPESQLVRYFGWSNSDPAQIYLHLNWFDIAKSMIRRGK